MTGALDLQQVNIIFRNILDSFFVAPGDQTAKIFFQELVVDLHCRESDVPAQRFIKKESDASAVFRNESKLGIQASPGRIQRDIFPHESHLSAGLIKTHDTVRNTELTLSRQTADTEDLALTDIKIHITDCFTGHIDPEFADRHDNFFICSFIRYCLFCVGSGVVHRTSHHPAGHFRNGCF